MRQIAHSHIYHLSFEFSNPESAAWLMRDFLNTSTRKTKQTLTRNLLLKLKNIKVGVDEVEDISEHLIGQQKSGKHSREEKYAIVKDIMKHKLNDAERVLKQVSRDLNESKENLSKVVRENTFVRKMFIELVGSKEGWEIEKRK